MFTREGLVQYKLNSDTNYNSKDEFITEIGNFNQNFFYQPVELARNLNSYPNVLDSLRAKTGNYWLYHNLENNLKFSYYREDYSSYVPVELLIDNLSEKQQEQMFFSVKETVMVKPKEYYFQSQPQSNDSTEEVNNRELASNFGLGEEEPVETSFYSTSETFDLSKFETFVVGGDHQGVNYRPLVLTGSIFTDHTIVSAGLYRPKEIETFNQLGAYSFADIQDSYNYYVQNYEILMTDGEVHENNLPNLYSYYLSQNPSTSQRYKDTITLGDVNIESTISPKPNYGYYDKFATSYQGATVDKNTIRNKYQNLAISLEDIGDNKELAKDLDKFPMSVNISFKTDNRSDFINLFGETKMSSLMLKYMIKYFNEGVDGSIKTLPVFEKKDEPRTNVLRRIDMKDFLSSVMSGQIDLNFDNLEFLGKFGDMEALSNTEDFSMSLRMYSQIFYSKMIELVDKHFRTYREMMAGKTCYYETVFYKIGKYRQDGETVQEIYLPNSSDLDIHEYIDTQVKYGTFYTYKIFAYNLVVGSEYEYEELKPWLDSYNPAEEIRTYYTANVISRPSVQLLEVEVFSKPITVLDAPSVAPEVEFVPYKGVNNKIKIIMNNSVGTLKTQPFILSQGEKRKIEAYRFFKDLEEDDPITFTNDDYPKQFELFRLSVKPRKYSDFFDAKRILISTKKGGLNLPSITHEDTLSSNRKYYYMIRTIDIHNNVSLPTNVFEVEIVDDAGAIYPVIREFKVEELNNDVPTKSMKRLLKLKPATAQLFFDNENLKDLDEAPNTINKLGIRDSSLWNKKYKMRLSSKQTGKKIDFNFTFKYRMKKNDKQGLENTPNFNQDYSNFSGSLG